MYKPMGCSYVMLGVSIFCVKDMFVIECGRIDCARLRTVSIKQGDMETQKGLGEKPRDTVCLYFKSAARGRGQRIMVRCRMRFPMDRTIHDPDRIRSRGQMEAALIRPIVLQELGKFDVRGR
jgi:hypothetical protein